MKFSGDKATFDTNITKQELESKLMVKDTYGNILPGSIYDVTYSTDGSTFTSTFPTEIGSYVVRVTGNGKNYAGTYDVSEREFMISVEIVDVSNVSATYKNAAFTIDDIFDQIKIFVNNVEMPKDNFDIALGVSNPKQAGAYTIVVIGKQGTAYESMGGTGTFTIEPAEIQFTSVTDRTYCGHSHDPEMTVAGVNEEQVLINKDYTVTYSGENYSSTTAPTDAGHYSVIVSGLGNYQGQVARSYSINPVSLTLDAGGAYIAVELVNSDVVYNTQKQEF